MKQLSFVSSVTKMKLAIHITLNVLVDFKLLFNTDSYDEGKV